MDTQTVIDTATAANAAVLGNPVATEFYRAAAKNAYKVSISLSPADKELVKRIVPFNVIFSNTKPVAHDHLVIAALRQLARHVAETVFKISKTSERTLVVGSSMREISLYADNPSIHHYVYGGEAKDVDRIIRPALVALAQRLKNRAAKTDRRVYHMRPDLLGKEQGLRRPAKCYVDICQILEDYQTAHKMPPLIHTEVVEANTLVFEDSIYNFTPKTLTGIFNKARANIAYGYAFMPMELLYPELPPNRLY